MSDKSALLEQLRLNRGAVESEKPRTRFWWTLAGVAALAALTVGTWLTFVRVNGIPVRTVIAQEAAGSSTSGASLLDASGYVVARRQATVSSKITGKVLEVLIEEGEHVAANQVLARLDDSNSRAGQFKGLEVGSHIALRGSEWTIVGRLKATAIRMNPNCLPIRRPCCPPIDATSISRWSYV
jgi:biotin carboxyl carrier protein